MGFSVNILTLLALVLATGLVVDDAIVVLENIVRRRGQGIGPRAAAVLGTQQVFFAVVATTDDARRGLRAALVPARPDRRALPRVRHHARALGGDLRLRRAVALPDDGLADAARGGDASTRDREPVARFGGRLERGLPPAAARRARRAAGRA